MNKLFSKIKMSWLTVIIFAIVAGAYTGAIMTVPALKDTSFQDIGIGYEWWVIFAVIVVVNCRKSIEAMLKCFVFFLISQPLVYIVEILLGCLAPEMGWYYYRAIWFPMTLLTIPGGFIAYFCKKQNIFGAIILGIGNAIQLASGIYYFGMAYKKFPNHILSGIVSVVSIFVMSYCIQKKTRYRVISVLIPILLYIPLFIWAKATGRCLF